MAAPISTIYLTDRHPPQQQAEYIHKELHLIIGSAQPYTPLDQHLLDSLTSLLALQKSIDLPGQRCTLERHPDLLWCRPVFERSVDAARQVIVGLKPMIDAREDRADRRVLGILRRQKALELPLQIRHDSTLGPDERHRTPRQPTKLRRYKRF